MCNIEPNVYCYDCIRANYQIQYNRPKPKNYLRAASTAPIAQIEIECYVSKVCINVHAHIAKIVCFIYVYIYSLAY